MDSGATPVNGTVFVLTAEPPQTGGGVEHFVRELVQTLEKRQYSFEVFHRGNSEPAWLARRTGRFGRKLAGTLCGYWVGRSAQRHMSDDVVAVISNGDVGYYPLRRRTPLRKIHFYHGTYRGQAEAVRPFIRHSGYLYLKWWSSMVLERLSGRGGFVLSNSDQTREEVRRFFGYNSITTWLPVDTNRFRPRDVDASRATLKLPKAKAIGSFVGSLHPMKGFPLVKRLIERLPEVHWVLALRGESPNAQMCGPNVTILQNVAHDQIPLVYCAADFSVCPSLYEPFGYVVAESLACGTPVISSPGGASSLLLRESPFDRLLIQDRDSTDTFLAAAREILRDPAFYRSAVIERVRPRLQELLAPENWWQRFAETTGL
jgi:glycosyltransferase involved in cell wall biosynthesis